MKMSPHSGEAFDEAHKLIAPSQTRFFSTESQKVPFFIIKEDRGFSPSRLKKRVWDRAINW